MQSENTWPFHFLFVGGGKTDRCHGDGHKLPNKKKQQLLVAKEVVARRCVWQGLFC